jgi:hypothetical protein
MLWYVQDDEAEEHRAEARRRSEAQQMVMKLEYLAVEKF